MAHELEQIFRARRKISSGTAAPDTLLAYPHAPTAQTVVHFVNPNARNEFFWEWDVAKPKKKKARRGEVAGASEAADPPPHRVHASIMDAYEAAKPGEVIKLRAGRHMLSPDNKDRQPVWEELASGAEQ